MVEKPKKKSRRKVSKEGSTEDQPNPGVRFLTDYFEVKFYKNMEIIGIVMIFLVILISGVITIRFV